MSAARRFLRASSNREYPTGGANPNQASTAARRRLSGFWLLRSGWLDRSHANSALHPDICPSILRCSPSISCFAACKDRTSASILALSSVAFLAWFLLRLLRNTPVPKPATPATAHPTGDINASKVPPVAMPPPPAAIAPPPSHARAALVAAAPDKAEIAVPVEAVPNVVATAIAAVGPNAATPTPAVTPAAPVPAPSRVVLAAWVSRRLTVP